MIRTISVVLSMSVVLCANAEIKPTPGGKPDLSGFYDSGTLTPLNRPERFGEKQFMTREEAEAIVDRTFSRGTRFPGGIATFKRRLESRRIEKQLVFFGTLSMKIRGGDRIAWFFVLSPYLVWQLLRLTLFAWRRSGTPAG